VNVFSSKNLKGESTMRNSFAEPVGEVKGLSVQEKQELQGLIEQYLIEERREEIYTNYLESQTELNEGEVAFSSDTDTLKRKLTDD
jgi:hypothetical protein